VMQTLPSVLSIEPLIERLARQSWASRAVKKVLGSLHLQSVGAPRSAGAAWNKELPSSERGNALSARTARRTERTSGLCGKAAPFAGTLAGTWGLKSAHPLANPERASLRRTCGRRVFPSLPLPARDERGVRSRSEKGTRPSKDARTFPPAGFGPERARQPKTHSARRASKGEGVAGLVPFRRSTRNRCSRAVGARTSPRMQKSAERLRAQRSTRSAVDGSEAQPLSPGACEREPALDRKRIGRKGGRFFESRRSSSYERRDEKNASRITLGLRAGAGSRGVTVDGRDSRPESRTPFTRRRAHGLGALQSSTRERRHGSQKRNGLAAAAGR